MKVVVAIDSLKGSLTSMEAGNAAKKGILAAKPDAEVIVKPLADGGEGTTDALIEGMQGEQVETYVRGPFGERLSAYYGRIGDTAVMEMAAASGITLISQEQRDPMRASTYGVGELICDAMEKGCRNFIIGIGGSATNDGGIGMLKALGFQFLDQNGNDVGEGGQALAKVAEISAAGQHPKLKDCFFQIACDVTNPLCGENGATYVFGPQKGVTGETKAVLDQGMANFAAVTKQAFACDHANRAGAGAAGGLGFAFLSYMNAELKPGIDLILQAVDLESCFAGAEVVVTGEGCLDRQSVMGKAPVGVAKLAKKHGLKVVAFAGSVSADAGVCNEAGIDAFFPIVRKATSLKEAMETETAKANMCAAAEQVFRLL